MKLSIRNAPGEPQTHGDAELMSIFCITFLGAPSSANITATKVHETFPSNMASTLVGGFFNLPVRREQGNMGSLLMAPQHQYSGVALIATNSETTSLKLLL